MALVADANTLALLHFDGSFTDDKGNAWSSVKSPTTSTTIKKEGTASLYTPSGSFIKATNSAFAFGAGDFTVDFWMYYCGANYSGVTSALNSALGVMVQNDIVGILNSGGGSTIASGGFIKNAWAHYALTRESGICRWFVNGAIKGTFDASAKNVASTTFAINTRYGDDDGSYAYGGANYYDEFRISNIARWTSDFSGNTSKPQAMTGGM